MTEQNNEKGIAETLEIGKEGRPVRRLGRWAAVVLALVIAAGAAWYFLKPDPKAATTQYKTEHVKRGDLTVIVTATGTLKPTNSVDVGSELSGIVRSVEADYNSRVKVGQILARIDTSKLEATITQSQAALESAQAKVLQTKATVTETRAKLAQLKNAREISAGRLSSQAEVDAAEAAFARAQADTASATAVVSQARAVLDANETDLAKAVIRSPINGIVLNRSIEPGQTVAAAFTAPVLFSLAEDLTRMDLHVNVDEADIGKIKEGQKATFTVAAYPNRTFTAQITQARYGSSTTSGVVTYETILKVANPDLALRPGMTATADITVRELKGAILVPGAALRFTPPVVQVEQKTSRGLFFSLFPRPAGQAQKSDEIGAGKGKQRVWGLKDEKPIAVAITTGWANGSLTEVTSGNLAVGTPLIVDILAGATK
ncbi:MAG: efflux RND transporter periplasmic adaptor subunit [Syntrophales bacterium]|jgi:HlyD family secretion protein|nr:efflux RND transporter periplasmic adaptor subunit [Syntrophales bacterium]